MPTCVRFRTDPPKNLNKVMHIKKAADLMHSGDGYAKLKNTNARLFDLQFMKDICFEQDYKLRAKTKPLRFMIFENYILGGVGTYVVGEVLSGIIRPDTVLTSTPGNLDCQVLPSYSDRLPGQRPEITGAGRGLRTHRGQHP